MGAFPQNKPAAAARATQPAAQAAPRAAATAQPAQQPKAGGFANSRPRGSSGTFLKGQPDGTPGKYVLSINRVSQLWANPRAVHPDYAQPTEEELLTAQPTKKGRDAYNIEVIVVESNVAACPPGFPATVTFTNRFDNYMGDIRGFIACAAGVDIDQVDLDDWSKSYKDAQPLANMLIDCIVVEKPTQKGGVFTQHIFAVNKQQHPDA